MKQTARRVQVSATSRRKHESTNRQIKASTNVDVHTLRLFTNKRCTEAIIKLHSYSGRRIHFQHRRQQTDESCISLSYEFLALPQSSG